MAAQLSLALEEQLPELSDRLTAVEEAGEELRGSAASMHQAAGERIKQLVDELYAVQGRVKELAA